MSEIRLDEANEDIKAILRGHLRYYRRLQSIVTDKREELRTQLRALEVQEGDLIRFSSRIENLINQTSAIVAKEEEEPELEKAVFRSLGLAGRRQPPVIIDNAGERTRR